MTIDIRSIRSAYQRYSPVYDFAFGRVLAHGRRELIRGINGKAGDRLLEVGVGTGLLLGLYPNDMTVTGIDVSRQMLDRARARVARLDLTYIELIEMDAEHMNFANARFDHVLIPYVYSVTPNPNVLMSECFRVCKPGGSIFLLNHFSDGGIWGWCESMLRPFSRAIGFRSEFSIDEYVHSKGWTVISIRPVNLLGLSRLIHIRCLE